MPFLRRRGNAPLESEARPPITNRESVEDAAADASLSPPSTLPLQASSSNMESASPWLESRASVASQRPEMTAAQEESNRQKRFSLLRFRNASDSQLSLRAKQQAEKPPPVPRRTVPFLYIYYLRRATRDLSAESLTVPQRPRSSRPRPPGS